MQLRKIGFFALVAVALVGCGTAALATTGTSTSGTTGTTSSSGSSSSAPECGTPAPGPRPVQTAFCETQAEESAGQTPVHLSGIPDAVLINAGITLTVAPSDSPSISEQDALNIAAAHNGTDHSPTQAVFGELHDVFGQPTNGQLVWVVNVSPSVPVNTANGTIQHAFVVIDAINGNIIGNYATSDDARP